MKLINVFLLCICAAIIVSCGDKQAVKEEIPPPPPPVVKEFGYVLDDYIVDRDTVQSGDTFGQILFENHVGYAKIQAIADSIKDVFDIGKILPGKPYVVLKTKDTTEAAKIFIYQKNKEDYVVVDFEENIQAEERSLPVTIKEREISGVIEEHLSATFENLDTSILVGYKMADIYAWTIDFFKLAKGDRFKVVFEERYVNDTVYAGIGKIKASLFEHKGREIYAYRFEHDSLPSGYDYFDEKRDNLRRAFLKGPLKFNRVSSRYNLNRRIAYYGYKVRPHKGTDFAGPIGTSILATADGTVTKSERLGGNGNYVKIRHNGTYDTQYLHMQKRLVRVGDFVRQGDVIGTIGMTGNTGGPHVCYRFWKNGKQVDPFKEDLPASEPLAEYLIPVYDSIMQPLRLQLDAISFPEEDAIPLEDTLDIDIAQN